MSVIDAKQSKQGHEAVAKAIKGADEKGVLLRFYMDGCPHCEKMDAVWTECAAKLDAPVVDIEAKDIEKVKGLLPNLAESKGGFPQVLKVDNEGKLLAEHTGGRNLDELVAFFTGQTSDESVGQSGGRRRRTRRRSRKGGKKSKKGGRKSKKGGRKSKKYRKHRSRKHKPRK